MKNRSVFRLRITAYSPDTIPMARLAEYMQGLAALMGSEGHVHLKGLTKGSTVLSVEVEDSEAARVEDRLRRAVTSNAVPEVSKAMAKLEALLRDDNARGALTGDRGERFIKFLGIDAVVAERIGPIREASTLEGEVVRVGGKDRTLHALLVAADGQEYKLTTTSRDRAKQLAVHLFSKVRVTGTGVWYRSEAGEWELDELKLESFEPLSNRTLMEAVAELRSVQGSGWEKVADPLALLRNLRKH